MSVWKEIKKTVNTRIESPINHLLWLNDYKISGEESYVFYDKSKLYELYRDGGICLHDTWIYEEAMAWCVENEYAGPFLSAAYDLDVEIQKMLNTLNTPADVVGNGEVYKVLLENETAMRAIKGSQAMIDATIADSNALLLLAQSTLAMSLWGSNTSVINAIETNEAAFQAALNNSIAVPFLVKDTSIMATIAADLELMTFFASSAMHLNAVAKNTAATKTFANSAYLQQLRTTLASTVTNTTYFTAKETNKSHSTTDTTMYLNGSSLWTETVLSADRSFVFVSQVYSENATNKSTVTGLLKNDTIAGTAAGWSDVPYLFIGGLKSAPYSTGSSYDSHGVKTSVYVAK